MHSLESWQAAHVPMAASGVSLRCVPLGVSIFSQEERVSDLLGWTSPSNYLVVQRGKPRQRGPVMWQGATVMGGGRGGPEKLIFNFWLPLLSFLSPALDLLNGTPQPSPAPSPWEPKVRQAQISP